MRFSVQAISVPKDFLDPKAFERAIENFLDAGAENIRVDFQVTTQTWREKPKFTIEKAGRESRWIYTGDKIYKFISGGTSVRYATMTPDFIPKTQIGYIGSGAGRGGVAFVNKKYPRPGIKAREFPKAIVRKWRPKWVSLFIRMQQSATGH